MIFLVPVALSAKAEPGKIKKISAPEVKEMLESGQAVLVNVLSGTEYEMQHIPDSINIPIIHIKTTTALPRDKTTPLIFYCMGKRLPYSVRAARIAAEKGYTNVYVFAGGIPEWRKFNYPMVINPTWQKIKVKKIPPKDLAKLINSENFFILDVRPLNFKKNTSFIKGSVLCPLVCLADRYHEIPKGQSIIITDWAMKQSPVAAKFLITKGYTVAGILKGGIERWESDKLPVEARKPMAKLMPLSSRNNDPVH